MSDDRPALPHGEDPRHLPAERGEHLPAEQGSRLPAEQGSRLPDTTGGVARRDARRNTSLVTAAIIGVLIIAVLALVAALGGSDDGDTAAKVGPGQLYRLRYGDTDTVVERLSDQGTPNGELRLPGLIVPAPAAPVSTRLVSVVDGTVHIIDGTTLQDRTLALPAGATAVVDLGTQVLAVDQSQSPVATIDPESADVVDLRSTLERPDLTFLPGFRVIGNDVVAIAQANTSVIVPLDRPGDAYTVDGIAAAVGHDNVLTTSMTDGDMTLQLNDKGGARLKPVKVPPILAARLLSNSKALVVVRTGSIVTVDFDAGSATQRGSVLPGEQMAIVGDERIIVANAGTAQLLDPTGREIATIDKVGDHPTVSTGTRCSVVVTPGGDGRVVDNDTGKASDVFQATAPPTTTRDDGCAIGVLRPGGEGLTLIRNNKVIQMTGTVAAWSPDGKRAVMREGEPNSQVTKLVDLDTGRTVEIDRNLKASYAFLNTAG